MSDRGSAMRIGIVGGGALGLTFAAALAAVHDVIVLDVAPAVVAALERDGIVVEGDGTADRVRVRATADPRMLRDRDAVIVAVKAYATHAALAPLAAALPAHALVVSLQNGLDNDLAARAALPHARLAMGVTTQGATALGPGRIRPVGRGATTFARESTASPTSDDLAAAFGACGLPAEVVDDAAGAVWRKLIVNAAINPLGALTGRPNGAVVDDPDLMPLAQTLAREAALVAASEGAVPDEPWLLVQAAARETAANRNSMLQDLDAHRRTENDAIGGALLRRAARRGLSLPLTETLTRLIAARERA